MAKTRDPHATEQVWDQGAGELSADRPASQTRIDDAHVEQPAEAEVINSVASDLAVRVESAGQLAASQLRKQARQLAAHLRNKQRELYQQMGRSPTVAEIAAGLDVDEQQVQNLMTLKDPVSLELPLNDDSDSTLGDLLPDDAVSPLDMTLRADRERATLELLHDLPEREARILELRHGFGSGESMSLQQVGNTLALSRERVRQLEKQTLDVLRERSELHLAELNENTD